ncbi:MFS transporter [Actinoplanes sp. HUAS TT8]|uniref:MFS transporter n=1 Tax=Actinoplanes sp. HUAS TT8 TaxID=3447453 RepID=UPI003F524E7F
MISVSATMVARARRWMTLGLAMSIIGTRIVDGGSNGAVAETILPLTWLAVLATAGAGISFAAPLIAGLTAPHSPARTLVASDLVEAVVSGVALALLVAFPARQSAVLGGYLLVVAIFPTVMDVVEELYAQQIAQWDEKQALAFNANIYSVLGFVGLVVGMPLGSWLTSRSIAWLVAANALFSLVGSAFRFVSSRTLPVGAVYDQDAGEYSAAGGRMRLREFLGDLLRTGPASPAMEFVLKVGATVSGVFVYLWVASFMPWPAGAALAVVLFAFGVGATIGPYVAPMLRRRLTPRASLLVTYAFGASMSAVMAASAGAVERHRLWVIGVAFVLLLGVVSRARAVLTVTLRQQSFKGKRFVRIMSWSFSFVAAASILGNWLGVLLDLPARPAIALAAYAATSLVGIIAVLRALPAVLPDRESLIAGPNR